MSNFSLKILAGIFMVLGHLGIFISNMPEWFKLFGIFSTPIFLFCLVEGFYNTRSRRKYLNRLLLGALIVAIGNCLIEHFFERTVTLNENLFFILALGIILMNSVEFIKSSNKSIESILMFIGTIMIFYWFEGDFISTIMILIFYIFRKDKKKICILYTIIILIYIVILKNGGLTLSVVNYIWIVPFSILPILMYNDKKGALVDRYRSWFYILYPLQLWGLYLIGYIGI